MCIHCAERLLLTRAEDEDGAEGLSVAFFGKLNRVYRKAWKRQSTEAVDEGMDAYEEGKTARKRFALLMAALSLKLRQVFNDQERARQDAIVKGGYSVFKRDELGNLGQRFSMSPLDSKVVRHLQGNGPFWIGNLYEEQLSARINEVGKKVIIESGLGREEAGKVMKEFLRNEFRGTGGPMSLPFDMVVPPGYAGRIDDYTKLVAANVAQRERVYSSISAMADAGISTYVITAVLDERTSAICLDMHGREFSVQQGVDVLNRVAAAETVDDFKAAARWIPSAAWISEQAGNGTAEEQSANLAEAGVALPPYHGYCRTTVQAKLPKELQ